MTTLPLRTLLREPATVKKLTAGGQSVQITDGGKPLWVVSPMTSTEDMAKNALSAADAWEAHFEGLLEASSTESAGISISTVLEQSRGGY